MFPLGGNRLRTIMAGHRKHSQGIKKRHRAACEYSQSLLNTGDQSSGVPEERVYDFLHEIRAQIILQFFQLPELLIQESLFRWLNIKDQTQHECTVHNAGSQGKEICDRLRQNMVCARRGSCFQEQRDAEEHP